MKIDMFLMGGTALDEEQVRRRQRVKATSA